MSAHTQTFEVVNSLAQIGPDKARNTVQGHTYQILKTCTHSDMHWFFNHFKYRNRSSQAGKVSSTLPETRRTSPFSVGLLMMGSVICLLNETQKYIFTLRMFTCN